MNGKVCIGAAIILLATPAQGRTPPPGWRVYADCAAAYVANARIADPDRPAAMTSQISDVANDYARAARDRYRRERKSSPNVAARQVRFRIDGRARSLAGQPREAVERLIDACPQPPE